MLLDRIQAGGQRSCSNYSTILTEENKLHGIQCLEWLPYTRIVDVCQPMTALDGDWDRTTLRLLRAQGTLLRDVMH